MVWFVKHWDDLTRDELYDLLAVRTAVFVVEQRCPYQEADGLDRRAWHVFARDICIFFCISSTLYFNPPYLLSQSNLFLFYHCLGEKESRFLNSQTIHKLY